MLQKMTVLLQIEDFNVLNDLRLIIKSKQPSLVQDAAASLPIRVTLNFHFLWLQQQRTNRPTTWSTGVTRCRWVSAWSFPGKAHRCETTLKHVLFHVDAVSSGPSTGPGPALTEEPFYSVIGKTTSPLIQHLGKWSVCLDVTFDNISTWDELVSFCLCCRFLRRRIQVTLVKATENREVKLVELSHVCLLPYRRSSFPGVWPLAACHHWERVSLSAVGLFCWCRWSWTWPCWLEAHFETLIMSQHHQDKVLVHSQLTWYHSVG